MKISSIEWSTMHVLITSPEIAKKYKASKKADVSPLVRSRPPANAPLRVISSLEASLVARAVSRSTDASLRAIGLSAVFARSAPPIAVSLLKALIARGEDVSGLRKAPIAR